MRQPSEFPNAEPKLFPLPEGEGQGEGKQAGQSLMANTKMEILPVKEPLQIANFRFSFCNLHFQIEQS